MSDSSYGFELGGVLDDKPLARKVPKILTYEEWKANVIANAKIDNPEQHQCNECNGTHYVDCDECDGSGEIYIEPDDCDECDGEGKFTCDICDGEGKIVNAHGVKVSCDECDGDGTIVCDACDLYVDCPVCDGDCQVLCPQCEEFDEHLDLSEYAYNRQKKHDIDNWNRIMGVVING